MDSIKIKEWIKSHEGYSSFPYLCTSNRVTIGWGHNLDDLGITPFEAEFILDNDIERCIKELSQFSWYASQPENVQAALINMCFNMGISRLLGFKRMITALNNQDYTKAAMEALDSKWATQVGQRAKDVALMMRQGHE